MMKRRQLLHQGLQFSLILPLLGHTPFPQWKVYRQRHLFIASDRSDPTADALSHALVEILERDLPAAEAKVTRAVDAVSVASLLSTEQLDVVLMQKSDALDWMAGDSKFQSVEPVPLKTLVDLGDYLLLCRADFPDHHAALLTHALEGATQSNSATQKRAFLDCE